MEHRKIDERSLRMHAIISERLRQNPELLEVAKERLAIWLRDCPPANRPALREWQEILKGGLSKTLKVLADAGENSTRLRQSSPFAGEKFITKAERTKLIMRAPPL